MAFAQRDVLLLSDRVLILKSWLRGLNDAKHERISRAVPLKRLEFFLFDDLLELIERFDLVSWYYSRNNK